jgi:CRISPR-associated protein Cmr2
MTVTADAIVRSEPTDLIVVSLPGVQRFIAEAQSTSDVRAASEIVAELARTAATACLAAGAVRLVLPGQADSPDQAAGEGLPNRVVALAVPGLGPVVGRAAVAAVGERWKGWLRQALGLTDGVDLPPTDGFPLVQWVCVPSSAGDYARQWEVAGRALAARRRVRDFGPVERFGHEVCSVSPRWVAVPAPEGLLAHEKATLSGAGWVKRRWRQLQGLDGFASTAAVASAPFRREVLAAMSDPDVASAVTSLRDAARAVGSRREAAIAGLSESAGGAAGWLAQSGGPWVYPQWWLVDRLAAETGREKEDLTPSVDRGERAAKALAAVMAERGSAPLSAYLAVLVQDLDSMGSFLSGEAADAAGRRLSAVDSDVHGRVSRELQALAGAQRRELESRWLGVPVYAGGDDLLAFLPAATALAAARACHDLVPDTLPRASVAVLFFHFQGGLQPALERAHQLLETGKTRVPGKHALAVGYQRRSGASSESIQPWSSPGGTDTVEALAVFAANRELKLSPRLVVQLGTEREELASLASRHPATYRAELARLVGRHLSGDKARIRTEADTLADLLVQLTRSEVAPSVDRQRQPIPVGPERIAEVGVFLRQEAR